MADIAPSTQWGEFKVRNRKNDHNFIVKYTVGHAHESCPKCGSLDVLSLGVPTNNDTEAVYPLHWCACGHKWITEVED